MTFSEWFNSDTSVYSMSQSVDLHDLEYAHTVGLCVPPQLSGEK